MSVHVSAYIWEHSVHKGTELLLLLAIADMAHQNGVAFPSVATLAKRIRMSARNTQRVLQKLQASGELRVKEQGGPNGTHLLQVVMITTLPLFKDGGGDKLSGDKLSGDKTPHQGVTKSTTRGDTAMSPEPTEPKANRKTSAASRRTAMPDGFAISMRVRLWAKEKGFEPYLDLHLEHFLGHCKANGSKYVGWDEALMNCIRADWGGVRRMAIAAARRGDDAAGAGWWSTDAAMLDMAKKVGVSSVGKSRDQLRRDIQAKLDERKLVTT